MKITFIISGLSSGGVELMLLKIFQHLDSRLEAYVVSLGEISEVRPRIEALGISILTSGIKPGIRSIRKAIQLILKLRELKSDVTHTWMYL